MRLSFSVRPFAKAHDGRAWLELIVTLLGYGLFWTLALMLSGRSSIVAVILAIPAGAFLLRLFLLQHDLGHGSFFTSRRLNDVVGSLLSVLTLIPYFHWRRVHNHHHAHSGDLDNRGAGDVKILTIEEYLELGRWHRALYRLRCHPLYMFGFAAPMLFMVVHRIPYSAGRGWRRERLSVYVLNVVLVVVASSLASVVGWSRLLLVQLPLVWLCSAGAVWLFLIQHCFENAHWRKHTVWEFELAALEGSTFYDLPAWLQQLLASVGFHHVHHVSPAIPSYRLAEAHRAVPELLAAPRLTLRASLAAPRCVLWDSEQARLIGFSELRARRNHVTLGPRSVVPDVETA